MTYDVFYFIRKFESIPEENWFKRDYINPFNSDQKCALGHCGKKNFVYTEESDALNKLFDKHNMPLVHLINDGYMCQYNQDSPKQRILAALHDIKKLEQPKEEKPLLSTTQQFKEITFEKIKEEVQVPQSVN